MNKSKRIFLIEDDEQDQYFFNLVLESIDKATLHGVAENGKDAMEKLKDSSELPDFIFTDIQMPQMDGIACISILQATQTYKSIPIVVLSSDTSQIEVVRKMGARAFIKKTSDLKALTAQVVQALAMDQTSDFFTNARDHNRL